MVEENGNKENFQRVCWTLVDAGQLDLLAACEVGGHRLGPLAAGIPLDNLLQVPFGEQVQVTSRHNYFFCWNYCEDVPVAAGAAQPGDPEKIRMWPVGDAVPHKLSSAALDPELFVQYFKLQKAI